MSKKELTFEESIKRLEQIVSALERGEAPLEQSLALFQEGTDLVRKCQNLLDNAKLQVKKIAITEDGEPVEEDFHAELS